MAGSIRIAVNGLRHKITASLDTPLLYVLHNELHLHGPRFGCGLAQCGPARCCWMARRSGPASRRSAR
jgi:aerobic-type carbon monoxide dehydrogenase small subunit (CoxS/CutS family)